MALATISVGWSATAAISLAAVLCGCSPAETGKGESAAPSANASPVEPAAPGTPPVGGATIGGDGSAITLAGISLKEVESAKLYGELACSFSVADAPPLLIAMGDVASKEPSQGVVKVASSVERIAAPGGFDAMLDGAIFIGAGKTLRVVVTGPPVGDAESPPRPATLTYERADGASRAFVGDWICGP